METLLTETKLTHPQWRGMDIRTGLKWGSVGCCFLVLLIWNGCLQWQTSYLSSRLDQVNKYEKLTEQIEDQAKWIEDQARRIEIQAKRNEQATELGGATFVRWGKLSCLNETEMVYNGFAAGTHSNETGGLSDYVCLTNTPSYVGYTQINGASSWLVLAKMRFYSLYGGSRFNSSIAHRDTVKCAFCRSRIRRSMVMIPGTNMCPNEWHREYWGFLMSEEWRSKGRVGPVCVDHAPDPGTEGPAHGKRQVEMVHVKKGCYSTCDQHIKHAELTCVVCTR